MTETTPPEFNEIPEPTELTGAPVPESNPLGLPEQSEIENAQTMLAAAEIALPIDFIHVTEHPDISIAEGMARVNQAIAESFGAAPAPPTMEQAVAAAMSLMPETTAVGLASEPEVDFPEREPSTCGDPQCPVCVPTPIPPVQVLLRGANTNHFMTVLNVERNPDGSLMVEVRHTTA